MKTHVVVDWEAHKLCVTEIASEPRPRLILSVKFCGLTFKGEKIMLLLPDDKTATVVVDAIDIKGNPAPVEGLTFTSSDETVASVDTAGVITPVGLGTAIINVVADALIGEGEAFIAGMLDVQVIASQAVGLNISAVINA